MYLCHLKGLSDNKGNLVSKGEVGVHFYIYMFVLFVQWLIMVRYQIHYSTYSIIIKR